MALAATLTAALLTCSGGGSPGSSGGSSPATGPQGTDPAASVPTDSASPAAPESTVVKLTMAASGLSADAMDRSADPCTDFYQYACGGWITATKLAAGTERASRIDQMRAENLAVRKQVLAAIKAAPQSDATLGRLGAFYRACLDEAAIEKASTSGIDALLALARRARSRDAVVKALGAMHRVGVWAGFRFAAGPDFKNPDQTVLHLDGAGLTLRDRDRYLRPGSKATLRDYRGILTRVFALLGKRRGQARSAAREVIKLEVELARAYMLRAERRAVEKLYNRVDRKGLSTMAPGFMWGDYFTALGKADIDGISITSPRYLTRVAELARKKAYMWPAYLQWRIVVGMGQHLPKRFRDELAKLHRLRGTSAPPDRCLAAIETEMPDSFAKVVSGRLLDDNGRKTAAGLIGDIAKAHAALAKKRTWLSAKARAAAVDKLGKARFRIGYPDAIKPLAFPIDATGHTANVLNARAARLWLDLDAVGKAPGARWLIGAHTPDVLHNWLANRWTIPAGALQPPFFAAKHEVAVNFGGLALLVGNEITHAIDDNGARFDARGRMSSWWSYADRKAYAKSVQCTIDQYNGYTIASGARVDGRQTLRENLADLVGARAAYIAHRAHVDAAKKRRIVDGYTEDQQFFIALAQTMCTKESPAAAARRLAVDSHAPAHHRVNGTLRNMPEMSEAFSCKSGSAMRPAKRCTAW